MLLCTIYNTWWWQWITMLLVYIFIMLYSRMCSFCLHKKHTLPMSCHTGSSLRQLLLPVPLDHVRKPHWVTDAGLLAAPSALWCLHSNEITLWFILRLYLHRHMTAKWKSQYISDSILLMILGASGALDYILRETRGIDYDVPQLWYLKTADMGAPGLRRRTF